MMWFFVALGTIFLGWAVWKMIQMRARIQQIETNRKNRPTHLSRLVLQPDYSFRNIESNMQSLGLKKSEEYVFSDSQEEPTLACWKDKNYNVDYFGDARCQLRALQITGERADFLLNDMLNSLYMPSLEGHQLPKMFKSKNRTEVLLALLAAKMIGIFDDQLFYESSIQRLTKHRDPEIAEEAREAVQEMKSHGGAPFPTSLRATSFQSKPAQKTKASTPPAKATQQASQGLEIRLESPSAMEMGQSPNLRLYLKNQANQKRWVANPSFGSAETIGSNNHQQVSFFAKFTNDPLSLEPQEEKWIFSS